MARLNYLQNTDEYALIIDKDTAQALLRLTSFVVGDDQKSPRKYIDGIRVAMEKSIAYSADMKLEGSVYFNNSDGSKCAAMGG